MITGKSRQHIVWCCRLFAVFTAQASFGIGCTVQANSMALLANETFGLPTWVVGAFACLLTSSVILGGSLRHRPR